MTLFLYCSIIIFVRAKILLNWRKNNVRYERIPAGDLNKDGNVNVADLVLLQKFLLNIPVEIADSTAADVDGNGGVDVFDALNLRRIILNI